jgi:hypothetical protein
VKKEMNQTKIIALTIALTLVAVAAVGVAFAQVINTQNQAYLNTAAPQNAASQQGSGGYYVYVQPNGNGTYIVPCNPYAGQGPYSGQQAPNAYPPYGNQGWGMCGRFW